ncbi:MAG: GNAT family N-acetyltransferase [Acidimicrobiales bacterium]
MPVIEISPLEFDGPRDTIDGAAGVVRRVTAEYDPAMDPATAESLAAGLRGNDTFRRHSVVAGRDGQIVGLARMWVHEIQGNTDTVEFTIEVDPPERRLGVGTALLSSLLAECDRIGRTSVIGFGVDAQPNRGFWGTFGCQAGLVERQSRLWLDQPDPDTMQRWIDRRNTRAADYSLVHWRGNTPTEMLAAVASLENGMNDAPIDNLDLDDDVWTEPDVVAFDEYYVASGRERWGSVVLAADGSPAALSTITIDNHHPSFAVQGDTVVLDAHRQRGIGRWIKADMWQRIRREAPMVKAIDTTNAVSNDAMLSINVEMGFERLVDYGNWQAAVSDLKREISART